MCVFGLVLAACRIDVHAYPHHTGQVHPVPGAFTINTGDMAQIWSAYDRAARMHTYICCPPTHPHTHARTHIHTHRSNDRFYAPEHQVSQSAESHSVHKLARLCPMPVGVGQPRPIAPHCSLFFQPALRNNGAIVITTFSPYFMHTIIAKIIAITKASPLRSKPFMRSR